MRGRWTVVWIACAALVAVACSKKDEGEVPAEPPPKAVEPAQPTPEPAREDSATADALIERTNQCWQLYSSEDEAFFDCYAEDAEFVIVDSVPPQSTSDAEERKAGTQEQWAAFDEISYSPQLMLVNPEEKKVVTVQLGGGKHTGELQGMAPTDKQVEMLHAQIVEFADDNETVETDMHFIDQMTMAGELGMSPMPAREAKAWQGAPIIAIAKGSPAEQQNVETINALHEAFNAHDVDKVMSYFADDAVFHYVADPNDFAGKETIGKSLGEYYGMSSDVSSDTEEIWGAGDWVVALNDTTGTLDGEMPGMPTPKDAKGKQFAMTELSLFRLENGKVKEYWVFANGMAFATQLGLMPDPAAQGKGKGKGKKAKKKG